MKQMLHLNNFSPFLASMMVVLTSRSEGELSLKGGDGWDVVDSSPENSFKELAYFFLNIAFSLRNG